MWHWKYLFFLLAGRSTSSINGGISAGLPIVCFSIRGNTDLIENRKGGYLVEPYDVEAFSKAIGKMNNIKYFIWRD